MVGGHARKGLRLTRRERKEPPPREGRVLYEFFKGTDGGGTQGILIRFPSKISQVLQAWLSSARLFVTHSFSADVVRRCLQELWGEVAPTNVAAMSMINSQK